MFFLPSKNRRFIDPSGLTPLLLLLLGSMASGAPPSPILTGVFPMGGKVGTTVTLTVSGSNLTDIKSLYCAHPRIMVRATGPNQFSLTIPDDVPPGQYELQAVSAHGLSSTQIFVVSNRTEQNEVEPNNLDRVSVDRGSNTEGSQTIPLNVIVNGRIEKGDLDHFIFGAKKGQRVVIDCQAERIESRLRAVLELFDSAGNRLAVNRGYFGNDPLIDFVVPTDGDYIAKVFDLVYSGGADHFYRLAIDTCPRIAFVQPNVIERGKQTRVTLYGWNLGGERGTPFDTVSVEVTPPPSRQPQGIRLRSNQLAIEGFAYLFPGADSPTLISVTDAPVVNDRSGNHSPKTARDVAVPCDVSGQLLTGDEQDWFAIDARRGEVIWVEAYGERIGSPLDLEISLFDNGGEKELANFRDETRPNQSTCFSTSHVDPVGRWVAPADGRYLVLLRSVIGGLEVDPRRQYRLSLRREEPDVQLVAVPRSQDPRGLNLPRGGRCIVDILALRSRGMNSAIQISAGNALPPGIECPDIWIGPGADSAPLVFTANSNVQPFVGILPLEGSVKDFGVRKVRNAVVTHHGLTGVSSRIANEITFAVAEESPLKITANGHEPKKHVLYGDLTVHHSPGSILDVVIEVERREIDYHSPVRLIGVGLPSLIGNQVAVIPPGQNRGTISFFLPTTLPVGKYTLAVQAESTVPTGVKDAEGKQKSEPITVVSNTVSFDVQPTRFLLSVDPFAPRTIRRGEVVQVNYAAHRVNGFIGKIHTELDAPGEVIGLRGRGVTFVGQTENGSIQIIANDDAPLGQQPFLRLSGVGVLEDKPVFFGSCFLPLEVVK